jgi:hypothetical protein
MSNQTYSNAVSSGKKGSKDAGKQGKPKSTKEFDRAVRELEKEKRAYQTPKKQSMFPVSFSFALFLLVIRNGFLGYCRLGFHCTFVSFCFWNL